MPKGIAQITQYFGNSNLVSIQIFSERYFTIISLLNFYLTFIDDHWILNRTDRADSIVNKFIKFTEFIDY
jgi:hypothetical protein